MIEIVMTFEEHESGVDVQVKSTDESMATENEATIAFPFVEILKDYIKTLKSDAVDHV